ncbi:AAA family ATPase [Sphaerisporangium sp. NPDC005288]|uniref:AAA family ATPase n=1 Tax=Sphaerisporangium sp. NPDC005288 TaxID=3155114 RepID=UPI00339EAFBA
MTARAPRPARRNVVVLFIDLVGSTELAERLDPELLRHILDRYYQACTSGIGEHGGVVEKFIGDAIMAVFGIPISSEDDALRAVRAAHTALARVRELSDGLAPTHGIRLEVHCGVSAGEAVVIDTPGSDLRVIGDTVNTAARLQSAAGAGEILVGDEVGRMVRAQARLVSMPPLTLKGKSNPVRAWRVESLEPQTGGRDEGAVPLVGRDDEMDQLRQAYRRSSRGRRCCVVTLLGTPGIGKSRLVRDFVHTLPEEVTVLVGRCRSYGAGITYRPVAEMLEALNGSWTDIAPLMEPSSTPALRGLVTADASRSPRGGEEAGVEEISRAVRTLFEALARHRPLVVVWEDLHWAEPTLLDLIDDVATWLLDVAVLLVCVARPELLDARPTWGGGMACSSSLELGALDQDQMRLLVAALSAGRAPEPEVVAHGVDALCVRVADGSDGNPLFAELMLETLVEDGEDAPLPPTIQALLGARLDRLGEGEREVLERAAAIGHVFTADQLGLLCRDGLEEQDMGESLRRLLRHRMIRRREAPGSFQFTQTLTRDTVYAMTRKELRASWHLALADRLTGAGRPHPGGHYEESSHSDLTHHLEAACHLTRDVRPDDPSLPALTERAARALIDEGTQALHRNDLPAAVGLLERGRDLLPAGDPEHRPLAVRICDAGVARGDGDRAFAALDTAERMLPDDRRTRLTCAIQRETLAVRFGTRPVDHGALREMLAADPGDDLGWCRFHQLEALARTVEGRSGAAEDALREGLVRARSLGDRYEEDRLLSGLCELAQWSPTPLRESLALCDELSARFGGDRALLVPVLLTRARLLALSGEVTAARAVLATAGRHAGDLHLDVAATAVNQVRGLVESLVGRHAEAETLFRRCASALRRAGHTSPGRTLEAYAARELLRQGLVSEAGEALDRLEAEAGRPQVRGELVVLAARARIASLGGDHGAALAFAARAREALDRTDDPCLRGDVLTELARAYSAAGHAAEAGDAAERAVHSYLAKGAGLPAGRVRAWIAEQEGPR